MFEQAKHRIADEDGRLLAAKIKMYWKDISPNDFLEIIAELTNTAWGILQSKANCTCKRNCTMDCEEFKESRCNGCTHDLKCTGCIKPSQHAITTKEKEGVIPCLKKVKPLGIVYHL